MKPVAKRTITALSTAALVVAALLYVPFAVVLPVMIGLVLLVQLEFCQMVAKKHEIVTWLALVIGASILLAKFYSTKHVAVMLSAGGVMLAGFLVSWLVALFGKWKNPIVALGSTWLSVFYIPVMLLSLILIPEKFGIKALLYVIAIVKVSDMGGFALGMACGRHKMCPNISPNKSWEGLLGSILASSILSCLLMPMTHFGFGKSVLLGLAAAVVGTLGDLVESRFKRECEVKDSATFMPAGLGGFLDMFDSLIFAPAFLYPFLAPMS